MSAGRVETSALLSHESPGAIVAYRGGSAITAAEFLGEAAALADRLPPGVHVLNVCLDRYRFAVGLAACLLSGRVSLLPSTHTPDVIRQLAEFAPDVFCLTDEPQCPIALPRFQYPARGDLAGRSPGSAGSPWRVPQIPASQLAAIVFTSGSTGTPLPYHKTWGRLARCVRDGAPRLGLADGQRHTLIGTVPSQHMYGFESAVLLALLSGNAFSAERPFYPADIAAAVAAVPRPRVLVTTPIHLRTVLASGAGLPPLELIVSATAPLAPELAREAEAAFGAPLLEIYGSTETGQIATRRPCESPRWRLWPGVRLSVDGDRVWAQGGHVEQTTAMCDVLEILDEQEFLLHGRLADLVNIAGKRSSFAYLNAQMSAIAGVVDGAFFLPQAEAASPTGVARLAAAVVAPGLSAAQLQDELRRRIDPVFMPRPLLLVERLPRNATGKLPHHALLALLESTGAGTRNEQTSITHAPLVGTSITQSPFIGTSTTEPTLLGTAITEAPLIGSRGEWHVGADHPAFAGHFPGFPLLPGVVLLDAALYEIARSRGLDLARWQVTAVKFLATVRPGDTLVCDYSAPDETTIRFACRRADTLVLSGTLAAVPVPAATATPSAPTAA